MEQFSHDLTLALEETSKCARQRWGFRRRTRSTGNLRKLFLKFS
jgi:G patch domain-containing protein 2